MAEFEGDSQADFGLTSSSPAQEKLTTIESFDTWDKMNQLEFSLSRMERLPQTFFRVAQFLRDGSNVEGDRLLRHCLETLSQLSTQWPTALLAESSLLAIGVASAVSRRNESLALIREICRHRENQDHDSIADCIEDELMVKLKNWELALRVLLKSLSSENY